LRSRIAAAVLNRSSARAATGTVFQLSNARLAATSACSACSEPALGNVPITTEGSEGSMESKVSGSLIFSPSMSMGWDWPRFSATAAIACAIARRFWSWEKSVRGSFRNSVGMATEAITKGQPLSASEPGAGVSPCAPARRRSLSE
jgi:hypothetical protein